MQNAPAVEVIGVSKRYGTRQVLSDVGFEVSPGSVFVLLGANGAGKTTLTRCMTTLTRFDSGVIRIAGHDVRKQPHRVRSSIGLVAQFPTLDESLTVHSNLRTAADLMRSSGAVVNSSIGAVIDTFNLGEVRDQVVQTLSGGYRRRVDIAMSLLGYPEVLFLDEPTAGLDFPSRVLLWEILREQCALGLTIVLTTQDLSEAEDMATDGLVLRHGKVVARGTLEQLRARAGQSSVQLTFSSAQAAAIAVDRIGPAELKIDGTGRQVHVTTGSAIPEVNRVIASLDGLDEPPFEIVIGPPPLAELILGLDAANVED
ncbi:MAG: ABC transporter ATP-binding protein [Acidimicrobiia bacterium]